MMNVQIGPLAVPTAPLLWGAGLWLAHGLATRWTRRRAGPEAAVRAGDALWAAALAGFVVSRLAFVGIAWDDYAAAPWRVLDIRDGGWRPEAGVLAAAALLAWRAGRERVLQAPLAAAAVLVLAVWGLGSTALGLHRERPVPDVPLLGLDGQATRLPALATGQPTVVNLWATWCAPCRVELPVLAQAQGAQSRVRILLVNQGEDAATVQRFLASLPYPLQDVWLDRGARSGPAVDSSGLPTTLFYDAQGRLVHRHVGVINAPALAVRLRELQR